MLSKHVLRVAAACLRGSRPFRSAAGKFHDFTLATLMMASLAAGPVPAGAQQYSVTEIPPAAGQSAAPIGNAINTSGEVTGFIGPPAAGGGFWTVPYNYPGYPNGQQPGDGFFRYSSGTTLSLPSYNPNFFCASNAPTIGIGINASGQIAGAVCATTESPTAFSYQKGTFTLIPQPPGSVASWGTQVNSGGLIVGTALFPVVAGCPGNTYHTFLYDSVAGSLQDLGTFFGCSSYGAGINDSGQIVGTAWVNANPHGYLYNQVTATATDIGSLFLCPNNPGFYSPYTSALAINSSGQVTGYSSAACGNGPDAFLYSASGGMKDVGNLGGPGGSQGNAINSSGQITGLSWTKGNAALHAFLYANGSMVDLNSQISSADAAQYTLVDGVSINDSGQILVQSIKIATGQEVTVILTPVDSVPNVVGDTQDAATSALTAAGLVAGTVTLQPSTTVAPGIVISQDPGAGSSAVSGSAVNLVFSSGVTVPNLVGLPLSAASLPSSLFLGPITQQYSSVAPPGVIIAQSPAGGSSVAGGTAINLVISRGPAPVLTQVPNVFGDTQTAATTALIGAELTLGTISNEASSTVPLGEVSSQSPPPGDSVTVGSAVNVILSSGPPQMSVALAAAPQFTYNGSVWVVAIGIKNKGNVTADNIRALVISLNGIPPLSGAGEVAEGLTPGSAQYIEVTFPVTVTTGTLKLSGTYTAGTLSGNWSLGARVAVPPVP